MGTRKRIRVKVGELGTKTSETRSGRTGHIQGSQGMQQCQFGDDRCSDRDYGLIEAERVLLERCGRGTFQTCTPPEVDRQVYCHWGKRLWRAGRKKCGVGF